ncbi:glycerophosphodiester phosphodiesterase family protein [Polaribacter filamentus]|uniref:glycerophosphodiester phosphodiesterase family protein n=1 Tax=Polaribacter filamentus TaxID=53483 RepID=UPI0014751267|nr:glycerophosphodiester phosphodiesterase family protein [Polaribacter filamentus]
MSCSSEEAPQIDSDPDPDPVATVKPSFNKVKSILRNNPTSEYVMVLAHRGGFVSTPENSISAIQNSTDIEVDIVEMDVQLTKDNKLVVMHDTSINRTTNGSGLVSDYTLAELQQFRLLNPNGSLSEENVPSLKEALTFSKDKMHLFLDKGHDYLDLIYQDLVATNTANQTLIGGTLTWFQFNNQFSNLIGKINYIPRAGSGQTLEYINSFESSINPIAYFPSCDLISSNNDVFDKIKENNKWIFSTTLIGSNCSEVVLGSEAIWNWEITQGIDGIFTDKSQELVTFLTEKGLHNNE